jgi:oligopeptide/dipeptide ABC transporter ATP-binding protein
MGRRLVLAGLDLELLEGQTLGIAGESGSGKSTACRVITGTLGRHGGVITSGKATLGELDLRSMDERGWRKLRGRTIALVPQTSLSGLDPVMRIGRQLREAIRVQAPNADPKKRALELLDMVRMPAPSEVVRRYPHELSGGMRQRVMIALAISGEPELLVADEPTTALDVTVQRGILELLASLRDTRKMSLIFVTHDLAVVNSVSDSVAIMYAGMTVEIGPRQKIMSTPAHPYTRALLGAQPRTRKKMARLVAIPGSPPSPETWPRGCRFAPRCFFRTPACEEAVPALVEVSPGHRAACVRLGEI